MLEDLLFPLALFSALGSGLVAGVFFAFSTFVMKALGRLPPAQGIAAMQAINVAVINPWFLGVFLGTAAACALVALEGLLMLEEPAGSYLLAGGLLYLIGTFLVTMAFNVPRNNRLAALDPAAAGSAEHWSSYLSSWTRWNHVRTIAALSAAALLTVAFF
jgi:uncharacterized membrane protein